MISDFSKIDFSKISGSGSFLETETTSSSFKSSRSTRFTPARSRTLAFLESQAEIHAEYHKALVSNPFLAIVLAAAYGFLDGVLVGGLDAVVSAFQQCPNLGAKLKTMWEGMKAGLKLFADRCKSFFSGLDLSNVVDRFKGIFSAIGDVFSAIWDFVVQCPALSITVLVLFIVVVIGVAFAFIQVGTGVGAVVRCVLALVGIILAIPYVLRQGFNLGTHSVKFATNPNLDDACGAVESLAGIVGAILSAVFMEKVLTANKDAALAAIRNSSLITRLRLTGSQLTEGIANMGKSLKGLVKKPPTPASTPPAKPPTASGSSSGGGSSGSSGGKPPTNSGNSGSSGSSGGSSGSSGGGTGGKPPGGGSGSSSNPPGKPPGGSTPPPPSTGGPIPNDPVQVVKNMARGGNYQFKRPTNVAETIAMSNDVKPLNPLPSARPPTSVQGSMSTIHDGMLKFTSADGSYVIFKVEGNILILDHIKKVAGAAYSGESLMKSALQASGKASAVKQVFVPNVLQKPELGASTQLLGRIARAVLGGGEFYTGNEVGKIWIFGFL